jgi:hypothetical protein
MATIASEAITAAMTRGLDVFDLEDRLSNIVLMMFLLKWDGSGHGFRVDHVDRLGKPSIPNKRESPDGPGSTVGPRYPFFTARKSRKYAQAAQTDISRLRSV